MKKPQMKILVKLPNKLGDTIMSTSFLKALKAEYPEAKIDVIIPEGIQELSYFMPEINKAHLFSKSKYPGVTGNFKFGRMLSKEGNYDMFFCLPFSFSAALQAFFSKSKKRIGHNTEGRGFLLTHRYKLPEGIHVVEDYINILEQYTGKQIKIEPPQLTFKAPIDFELPQQDYIVLNVRSGPSSRFIPIKKAVSLIKEFKQQFSEQIVLTGAEFERDYIDQIVNQLGTQNMVLNYAGKTSIIQLGWLLKNAKVVITTDSGNAHFANAVNTPTVVLFGAGLQSRCHPYNISIMKPLQLLDLECVPCRSEKCKFMDNRCLADISNQEILNAMSELINNQNTKAGQ